MITSKDFAKMLGVSQSTVSRALNDSTLVPESKRKFIQQKAIEYGFVLNSQARSLKTNLTGTVGILFPKHFKSMSTNLMLTHLYDNIQRELIKYGYDIMVIYDYGNEDGLSVFERIIRRRKVDGFIILRLDLSEREIQLVQESNIPCVFILNAGKIINDVNFCLSDSEYGGYLAGKYFGMDKDYTKMFLSIKEEKGDAKKRLDGYRRGLQECDYTLREHQILNCDLSVSSAFDCIMENKELFLNKKTALFTYNDIIAIGAINALSKLKLRIPEDVQIIGMDDIPLSSNITPKLSTLHIPVKKMAYKSCHLLRELIEDKKHIVMKTVLKPQLILRETTKN